MTSPAALFPYPPDDPDAVRATATAIGTAAASLADVQTAVAYRCVAAAPTWRSADGDAAIAEVGKIAHLAGVGDSRLQAAAGALAGYATSLDTARSAVDGLRRSYAAAVGERDAAVKTIDTADPAGSADPAGTSEPAEVVAARRTVMARCSQQTAVLTGRRGWIDADVGMAAARAAGALRQATTALGLTTTHPAGTDTVSAMLAQALPMWGAPIVASRVAAAAAAVQAQIRRDAQPDELRRVLAGYAAWLPEPAFGLALMTRLGPDSIRALLASLPPAIGPRPSVNAAFEYAEGGRVLAMLGTALGAATRTRPGLPPAWISSLTRGLDDAAEHPDAVPILTGLDRVLQHGRYGAQADALGAPILAQLDHLPVADDVQGVGAMRAVATNRAATLALLGRPGMVDTLTRHLWPDGGAAFGSAVTLAISARDAAAAQTAGSIIQAAGRYPNSIGSALAPALTSVLVQYIESINRAIDPALPSRSGYPQPVVDSGSAVRALYAAMQNGALAARVLNAQLGYDGAVLGAPPASTTEDARLLRGLANNTGAVVAIFRKSSLDQAVVATLPEQVSLDDAKLNLQLAEGGEFVISVVSGVGAGEAAPAAAARIARRSLSKFGVRVVGSASAAAVGGVQMYWLNPLIAGQLTGSARRNLRAALSRWTATTARQALALGNTAKVRFAALVRAARLPNLDPAYSDLMSGAVLEGETAMAQQRPGYAMVG